jgi:dihydrolipoamide dehydrogenase
MGNVKKISKYNYDVIVIGAGSGGGVAAHLLAKEGKKVAIIEADKIGGASAHHTTIPYNSLIETVKVLHQISSSHIHGARNINATFNYQSILLNTEKAIARSGVIKNEQNHFKSENIDVIKGRSHFIGPRTITVNAKQFTAKKFIIATGSLPHTPNIKGLSSIKFLNYNDIARLKKLPTSACIIGGSSTAFEVATILNGLGVKAHIIEKANHLFPDEDSEIGDSAEALLTKSGVRVHTKAMITSVYDSQTKSVITFDQHGQTHRLSVEKIIVATGATPQTDLGLENTGIRFDETGIRVNSFCQTNKKHIYAIGDVIGKSRSAAAAFQEAKIAAHNITSRKKLRMQYGAMPRITHGIIQIAAIGKTEREMRLSGEVYQTSIAPLALVGKSYSSNYSGGFVKIVTSSHGFVLGASVVAPDANEMINELSVAISKRMRACDIADAIHTFPSWGEATKVAAQKILCI